MQAIEQRPDDRTREFLTAAVYGALRLTWTAVRLPVLAVLLALEPFVSFVASALTVLGVLTCLFWEFVVHQPHFEFWTLMAVSASFAVALVPYYGLIALFSARLPRRA